MEWVGDKGSLYIQFHFEKEKSKFLEGEGGGTFLGRIEVPNQLKVTNISWTCKKLHRNGEP